MEKLNIPRALMDLPAVDWKLEANIRKKRLLNTPLRTGSSDFDHYIRY